MANQDAVSSLIMGEEESKPIEKKAANANNYKPAAVNLSLKIPDNVQKQRDQQSLDILLKELEKSPNDIDLQNEIANKRKLISGAKIIAYPKITQQSLQTSETVQNAVPTAQTVKTLVDLPEQTGDAVSDLIMNAEPVKEEKSSPFGYGLKPAEVLKNLKPAAPSIAPQLQPPAVPLQETQADIDARRGLEAIQPSMKATPKPEKEITAKDVLMAPVQLAGQGVSRAIGATIGSVAALGKDIFSRVSTGKPLTQQEINKTYETFTNVPYEELNPASKKAMEYIAPIAEKLPPIVPGAPEFGLMAQAGKTAQVAKQIEKAIPPSARKPKVTLAEAQAQFEAKKAANAKLATEPTIPSEPSQMAGVGAAAVESSALKQARANELLIPMGDDYTRAQLTRNPTDVRYESDTAKLAVVGDPFQAKYALQNEKLRKNLQAEVEHTGAETVGLPNADFGKTVISEPFQKYKNGRYTEVSDAYKAADAAGETSELVPYKSISDFIKSETENRPTKKSQNPLYSIVEEELKANDLNGTGQISIKQMEDIRKLIIQEIDPQKKGSVVVGKKFKDRIDKATENAGGDLYKQARDLNTKFASEFEDIAIIRDINRNKKGLTDRVIPLEQLADRLVFKGPGSDLKSILETFEKMGPEGQKIITELKGYTADQIREKVTANIQYDAAGKPYVSTAALNKIVNNLDKSGKLEMLFGKQQAQRYRTLNEVTKELQTVPKDTTNPSGTGASVAAMILEAGGQTLLTGVPAPVISGIHYLKKSYDTKKALKKANEYANPNVKISDMVK